MFDLDGTLLDRHSSLIVFAHQQIKRCGDLLEGIAPTDYIEKLIELDGHGYVAKEIVFQKIENDFNLANHSWKLLFDDFKAHFPYICVPFPKLHQTLIHLVERKLGLGLITNGTSASQDCKIDGLGIRLYFETILVSETEGIRKPDPDIFQRALQKLGVNPEKAIFVGDHPEVDIDAAKAVGMKAIWMENSYWTEPMDADATITKLSELPQILDATNIK